MEGVVKATGRLVITLRDSATGSESVVHAENKVVNYGLNWIATKLINSQLETRTLTNMGIGKSSQPVAADDKWLMSESARVKLSNLAGTGATLVAAATFPEGVGTSDITELALFLSDTGCFARTVIPVQKKTATTSMDVNWTITLTAV